MAAAPDYTGYVDQPPSIYTSSGYRDGGGFSPVSSGDELYGTGAPYTAPAPAYDPLSSVYPAQPAAAPPASVPTGYATQPAGDDFTVDAQRFGEYEAYLNDFGQGLAPGVPADPLPAAPANAAIVPSAVFDPSGSAVYDTGGTYGGGGAPQFSSYPYPEQGMAAPGFGDSFGMDRSQLAQPGMPGFDPFAWSGTANPRPQPNPMREAILQAMGIGAQMEQQRAAAEQPQMNATNFVLHRLGLTKPEPRAPALPPVLPTRSAFEQAPRMGERPAPRYRPRGFVT